jgi:glycerol-3-phosphate dehydrogenase subunit C
LDGITEIVTLNATCDSTLRDEWGKYWDLHLSVPVTSFTEFALARAPEEFWHIIESVPDTANAGGGVVWVHTTCRSRVSRGDGLLEQLMRQAGMTSAQTLNLACCGAAGSYAFKEEHEDVARQMGQLALAQVHPSDQGIVVDSGTCGLHLSQLTDTVAKHPAYWLYQRYCRAKERRVADAAE